MKLHATRTLVTLTLGWMLATTAYSETPPESALKHQGYTAIYQAAYKAMLPFRRWLLPGSRAERVFIWLEKLSKGAIFDCRMCGQCVLHNTGMTCPMTCPKSMRNGPCGGVRPDGRCEVNDFKRIELDERLLQPGYPARYLMLHKQGFPFSQLT
jgi:hypothetical protein